MQEEELIVCFRLSLVLFEMKEALGDRRGAEIEGEWIIVESKQTNALTTQNKEQQPQPQQKQQIKQQQQLQQQQ